MPAIRSRRPALSAVSSPSVAAPVGSPAARSAGASVGASVDAPVDAPVDAMALSLFSLFGIAVCGGLIWMQGDAIEALKAELDARPPVAVVDYAPVAAAVADGRAPEEIEPLFRALKERAAALREDGYLVLNRAAIDGAPDAFVVRVDPPPQPAAPLAVAAAPPLWTLPPEPPTRAPAAQEALTDAEARALIDAVTGGGLR